VIVLAGGSYLLFGGSHSPSAAATTTTRVVAASLGTISQSVSTTGTIEPADQADLSFGASGVVTSVKVAVGDRVTKGQTLARIDSASLKASLAQAQSSLAAAQARVASDESSTATTDTQLAADQAAVTAAKGQVSSARTALGDATLTSPITGVVASVALSVGEQVSGSSGAGASSGASAASGSGSGAGSGSGTSTAQVEVIGTSSWEVDATVDATQLGLIKKGMQARITLDGSITPVFGTVSSVGVLPSSTSTTAAYPVIVKVTGNPSGLHSGASATLALIYQQLSNVLTVPSLALRSNAGTSEVTVVTGSKHITKTVTTGLSSGGQTQITKGLSAGDQVLVQVANPTGVSRTGSQQGNTGRFPGGGAVLPGGGLVFPGGAAAPGGGNGGFGGGGGGN
jgi:multidrug efflux pump subunit AcrA (membrane-fusion protein)